MYPQTEEMASDTTVSRAKRVERLLKDRLRDREKPLYLKSKHIADELPFSAKQIGSLWSVIKNRDNKLTIEKWSGTSSTTWQIKPESTPDPGQGQEFVRPSDV